MACSKTSLTDSITYHPSWEEFKDFNTFIKKIEAEGGGESGVIKVVPPKQFVPRKAGFDIENIKLRVKSPLVQSFRKCAENGAFESRFDFGKSMSLADFYKLSQKPENQPPPFTSNQGIEEIFWKNIQTSTPLYGTDINKSLADPDSDVWNLSKLGCALNKMSQQENFVIQGVVSPFTYVGMYKSAFSWHVEDYDLYAINIVHYGAPKIWYVVPPKHGHLLEELARKLYPLEASRCSNFLRHKSCLTSPEVLDKYNIPYHKVVQGAGEIVITFPYAYHQGFNSGFNIAEAVNFARPSWVEFGKRSKPCDCNKHRTKLPLDPFVKMYQPERYEAWKSNMDIAPHPMDPPEVVQLVKLQVENTEEYIRQKELDASSKRRALKLLLEIDANCRTYTIYQHHQLSNILVYYDPENGKTYQKKSSIWDFFQKSTVPKLIEQGNLIKLRTVTVKPRERKADKPVLKRKVMPKRLSKIKQLNKTQKRRAKEFRQTYKTKKVDLVVLKHVQKGFTLKVFPNTVRPAFAVSDEVKKILRRKDFGQLINDKVFEEQGKVNVELKQLTNVPVKTPQFLKCGLYLTSDKRETVRITEDKTVLDTHLEHVQNLLRDATVEDLLSSNQLVFDANVKLKRKPGFVFSPESPSNFYNPEDLVKESDLMNKYAEEMIPDYEELKKQEDLSTFKVEDGASTAKEVISKIFEDPSFFGEGEFFITLDEFANKVAKPKKLVEFALQMLADLGLLLEDAQNSKFEVLRESWDCSDNTVNILVNLINRRRDNGLILAKKSLREVLFMFLESQKNHRVFFYRDAKRKCTSHEELLMFNIAGFVLEGLGFIKAVKSKPGVFSWEDRNPYSLWLHERNLELKHCNLIAKVELPQINCPQDMIEKALRRMRELNNRTPLPKRLSGGVDRKKRRRCGVCAACKTKPCGRCNNCIIKSFKQACILRDCKHKTF